MLSYVNYVECFVCRSAPPAGSDDDDDIDLDLDGVNLDENIDTTVS